MIVVIWKNWKNWRSRVLCEFLIIRVNEYIYIDFANILLYCVINKLLVTRILKFIYKL